MSLTLISLWGAMLVHCDQHHLVIDAKDWSEFHAWQSEQTEKPEVPPFKPIPLEVTGIGKVKAVPDIAVISGHIKTSSPYDHKAYDEAAKIINRVQASIGNADIKLSFTELRTLENRDPKCLDHNQEARLRHSEVQSDKWHNDRIKRQENPSQKLRPKRARLEEKVCPVTEIEGSVSFTAWVRPAKLAGEYLNRFTEAGVNEVNLYGYDFSDYDALYKAAGEKAVINAKTKADIVAKGAGSQVTELVNFSISAPSRTARFGPQAMIISPHAGGAPRFKTVVETIVVQEASTELVSIPPNYENVMETVVVQPAYVTAAGQHVPAITQQISRRVIKTPAATTERVIPAVTKQISRRVRASGSDGAVQDAFSGVSNASTKTRVLQTGSAGQSNNLKMSLLSGPQTVTVTARMQFLYETPLNGVVFEPKE